MTIDIGTFNFNPSNDPVIMIHCWYDAYRSGNTMTYYIHVELPTIQHAPYFGYPIAVNIAFNGGWVVSGYYLKNTWPNRWDAYDNVFGPYYVNVGAAPSVQCRIQTICPGFAYLYDGFDTYDFFLGGDSASSPGTPEWGPSVNPSIADPGQPLNVAWGGGGGMGNYASFSYCELQWNWDQTSWGGVWSGGAFSSTVGMPGINRGGNVQFRVRVFNNYGLCSGWAYSNFVICDVLPSAPSSVTGSPSDFEPGTNVTFTWSGAAGGSYPISSYHVQYAINGGSWVDWANGYGGTSISSNSLFTARGTSAQVRVCMTNSAGYTTAWAYSNKINVNKAPTAPTSIVVPQKVFLSNPIVSISCSGATAGAGNIVEYDFDVQDEAIGTWVNVYTGPTAGYVVNLSQYLTLQPEHILQVRVRIRNSYGAYSSYLISPGITILGGILHIKINGVWQLGITWERLSGNWNQALATFGKASSAWKEGI